MNSKITLEVQNRTFTPNVEFCPFHLILPTCLIDLFHIPVCPHPRMPAYSVDLFCPLAHIPARAGLTPQANRRPAAFYMPRSGACIEMLFSLKCAIQELCNNDAGRVTTVLASFFLFQQHKIFTRARISGFIAAKTPLVGGG